MGIQFARCGKEIEKSRVYEHRGNVHREDCYMDILSPPKDSDPWAVYSAKRHMKEGEPYSSLTPRQQSIVNYIKEKKQAKLAEILRDLCISEGEWRREFSVLRHMEVLGATQKEGEILYSLFPEKK